MLKNFNALRERVAGMGRRTLAVAAAGDAHTLEAVRDAEAALGVDYRLVGDKLKILEICSEIGFDALTEKIIPADSDEESAALAVGLVRNGTASALMKGKLQTSTLLKAILNKETGIRGGGLMSHMAVLECPSYHKLLFMTDGGMNPHPDLAQKKSILENGVAFMHSLGYDSPKAAALAAAETVSDKMPETVDAAELARMNADGEITGCLVEGPLSFDLAISGDAAAVKGVESRVAGDVDLLLVPCISTGNIMSKALLYLGGAKMAGCVLGAKAPIILVSRGATAEEKLLSVLLALAV